MSFYNSEQGVNRYVKMCEGYDGSELYALMVQHIPKDSWLLEIGAGPGNDIDFLASQYHYIGSDASSHFLTHLQERFPTHPFIPLDAESIALDTTVDCFFSNKVLHHLSVDALEKSLLQQAELLSPKGFIAHSFWLGSGSETIEGLLFQYYETEALLSMLSEHFNVLAIHTYGEIEANDSLFVIAQKRHH